LCPPWRLRSEVLLRLRNLPPNVGQILKREERMPAFSTSIVVGEPAVSQRLSDWRLNVGQIVAIARVARAFANDASPLMPVTAPGTLAYIYGVQELRIRVIGDGWEWDLSCGVEAVMNRELGIRIGYQNVDRSCDEVFPPIPRSSKGRGAEYLNGPDLFEHFGVEPGPLVGLHEDATPTYYVMVGQDGSVELSRPIIKNGTYQRFVERIFVYSDTEEWEKGIEPSLEPTEEVDIAVSLKD
jgi:hypothetical protein